VVDCNALHCDLAMLYEGRALKGTMIDAADKSADKNGTLDLVSTFRTRGIEYVTAWAVAETAKRKATTNGKRRVMRPPLVEQGMGVFTGEKGYN
jgi:hypothetical protein